MKQIISLTKWWLGHLTFLLLANLVILGAIGIWNVWERGVFPF